MVSKTAFMNHILSIATKNEDGSITITPDQIEIFLSRKNAAKRQTKSVVSKPRKLTGYNLFLKEQKGKIIEVATKWTHMSNEEKDVFNKRAAEMPLIVKQEK